MSLTGSELAVLQDVVLQINQSAGYSYEVLVQGTVMSGILHLIAAMVWILLVTLVAFYTVGCVHDKYHRLTFEGAFIVTLIVAAILIVLLLKMVDVVMLIISPDYVVINNIVQGIV